MKILNQTPEHPANEELAAFALGKETPNAETIAEHVASCARCETLVATTPRDTFLGILNKAKPGASLAGPNLPKTTPTMADELPEELRQQTKYTFLKKLGSGGMGVVYLAEHNLMKRKVAVKLIPPEMIGNPAVRERFLQEVVSAAALEHPNVVRAYSAEEFGQHMAFEMEFVNGKDLSELVKGKGPLPVAHAVNYIRQAALGLQHGMLKSLVHRDIKPGNLMLTRSGIAKVADFGLAKFSRESEKGRDRSLTSANAMMGTPDYMAPEQARNAKSADIRADIYSLGCTFYYLLTGQPPFAGESVADLLFKHWEDPRPDVGLLRNDVPEELSLYMQKMMAKEPGDRPQSPKEAVDWLTKFAKGEPTKKEMVEKVRVENSPLAATMSKPEKNPGSASICNDAELFAFTEKRPEKVVRRNAPLRRIGILAGVVVATIVGLYASGAFQGRTRVVTSEGTIVIDVNQPGAEVFVDGEKNIEISWDSGKKKATIKVQPGKHRIQVTKEGFTASGSDIDVTENGYKVFAVKLERKQQDELAKNEPIDRATNSKTDSVTQDDPAKKEEAEVAKLKEVLLNNTWFYHDHLYPPGEDFRFNENGTFHYWKWKYWAVDGHTIRVHYDRNRTDKENGIPFTFNQELTEFSGEFTDPNGRLHQITGKRK